MCKDNDKITFRVTVALKNITTDVGEWESSRQYTANSFFFLNIISTSGNNTLNVLMNRVQIGRGKYCRHIYFFILLILSIGRRGAVKMCNRSRTQTAHVRKPFAWHVRVTPFEIDQHFRTPTERRTYDLTALVSACRSAFRFMPNRSSAINAIDLPTVKTLS